MPHSQDHNYYVQIIFDYVINNYPDNKFYIKSDLKIHDNVERVAIPNPGQRPPNNLIKIPDLVAEDRLSHHFTIMGEAKTYGDFRDDLYRVNTQLDYYLNRLKYKNNGLLVYALPHSLKNVINNLILKKKETWNTPMVNHIVLTDLNYTRFNT